MAAWALIVGSACSILTEFDASPFLRMGVLGLPVGERPASVVSTATVTLGSLSPMIVSTPLRIWRCVRDGSCPCTCAGIRRPLPRTQFGLAELTTTPSQR